MKTSRLARRLGLDGNPLRRRSDKITACAAALLLASFLTGAPLLSAAAADWAGRPGAAQLRAERSWHQVSAVLLRPVPPGSPTRSPLNHRMVLAREGTAAAAATVALGIILLCLT